MSARPLIIQAAMPPALAAAVKVGADREMTSVSEYLRRAVMDRLNVGYQPSIRSAARDIQPQHRE
jgi:hypothetical protein